jgi:hypothetical protein
MNFFRRGRVVFRQGLVDCAGRRQRDIEIAFTDKEWLRLHDLFRQAWEKPEITERMAALQLEYGEQG